MGKEDNKKRLTIGAIIGNANSPHMRDVMKGIQNAAEKLDCNIIYFLGVHMAPSFYVQFENEIGFDFDYQYNVVYDYALFSGCDALIISYGTISMFMENTNKEEFISKFSSIPYVMLLDRDDSEKGSSLMSNNYGGMYQIVEHLVKEHGYRKLAHLAGPKGNTDALERRRAFEDVLDKYNIPYDEKNFAVGDFTIRVDKQVNTLIDDNPGLEALVCANDLMADTAYKVCAKRGLVVGKDIAITGYDDWEMAAHMNPPLTTVTQSGFDTGYTAVEEAIEIALGSAPKAQHIPTAVKIRSSCGCEEKNTTSVPDNELNMGKRDAYVAEIVSYLVDCSLISTVNEDVRNGVFNLYTPLVEEVLYLMRDPDDLLNAEGLLSYMTFIEKSPLASYLSLTALVDAIDNRIMERIRDEKDSNRIKAYAVILSYIQKFTRSIVEKQNGDEITKYQSDTMFMPYISLEMMSHIEDIKDFYKSAMSMLGAMGVNSSYMFTSEHAMRNEKKDVWKLPEGLYMIACQRGSSILCNDFDEAPILNMENPLTSFVNRNERYTLNIYDVFMGENQYGILATETDPQNMLLMNLACMQISSAINFRRLFVRQQMLRSELEDVVSQLEEKNKILGFLSEYDQLTSCLNRRGYAEKAEMMFHVYEGKKAVLIMADLDHLKEINDTFGHSEGDYSIKSSANILQTALGMETLVSRIGGDEFSAIRIISGDESGEAICNRIRYVNEEFMEGCDKPYYVELSLGYYEFTMSRDLDIQELMKEADMLLYEDKKNRRESALKG